MTSTTPPVIPVDTAICMNCRLAPATCICAQVDAFFANLPPEAVKHVIKARNRK